MKFKQNLETIKKLEKIKFHIIVNEGVKDPTTFQEFHTQLRTAVSVLNFAFGRRVAARFGV